MSGSLTLARKRTRWALPLLLLSVGLTTFAFVGTAAADFPSDDRAEFVDNANATTCAQVGDSSPNILFTSGNGDNSDANVSGTVTHDPFDKLNVTLLNPNVQINAVVVKGGNGYNVYRGNFPDMIPPLNPGMQHPAISHWFVCYGPAQTPPQPPPGPPGGEGAGAGAEQPGAAQAGAAPAVRAPAQFTG